MALSSPALQPSHATGVSSVGLHLAPEATGINDGRDEKLKNSREALVNAGSPGEASYSGMAFSTSMPTYPMAGPPGLAAVLLLPPLALCAISGVRVVLSST